MSPALFQASLYLSLALCALGLVWRASLWFRCRIGPEARELTLSQRLAAALRGAAALLSGRVFRLLGVFLFDALLLRRLFANARLRWLGHLFVAVGFTMLLLMHALVGLVSAKLFPGYQPTMAPYLFLRNFFAVMVLLGVAMLLLLRRSQQPGFAPVHGRFASAFVALLGFVLVTGSLLEASKMASPRAFYRMAGQFIGSTDARGLKPLRAVWASDFGVAFSDLRPPIDPILVAQGSKLHQESCAPCHAKPAAAFVSYPIAKLLAPAADILDEARADAWLLYLHVFACFLGLASLPFTRFFHVVAAPIGLLVNAAAANRESSSAGRASRRALALDACVRCGICDLHCSVAPLARYLDNPHLLPSHKLAATGELASGRLLMRDRESRALRVADGAFLCTDCGRCTSRCPVGLDLDDLWKAGRADLTAAGLTAPAQWVQVQPALAWAESLEADPGRQPFSKLDATFAPLSADPGTFSRCVQCQTCTNVCPVVAHSSDGRKGIDLTPQKVMNLLRLGLGDLSLGSRMIWDCAMCYQCQENCPEGIRVADIMCELRALGAHRLGAVRDWSPPA